MTTRRDLVPALGVFVLALAWLLLLRPYGFQLEDEGTHLFWFDRVMRGQQPYVDFHTGYTPGFFALGKAAFSTFGPSATALRGVLAVINALAAAGLAEVTRRVAGRWLAWIPPLLWLAFVPVYVGEFAAFNVPYPTWPVTLAFVGLALAMLAWMERRSAGLLVVAGAAAALAMWFRPNSGAFALAAATWIVVAVSSRPGLVDRVLAFAAAAFMALGVWYTFEFRILGMDAFVHLLPAAIVVLLCTGPLWRRLRDDAAPRATVSLLLLATAFLVPTLAWALPLLGQLGRDKFLYEVFLVGADYQTLYYKPHPSPEPYAAIVVAALVAIAVAGRFVARGSVKPVTVLIAVAAVATYIKLAILDEGIVPEGFVHSIVAQAENASYWLAATTSLGAALWLGRVGADELHRSRGARAMVVLTPLAIAMYMQMFPRSDYMHQVTAVPLTMVAACGLLARVSSWWGRGVWPAAWDGPRIVRGGVLAAALSVIALGFLDKGTGPVESWLAAAPHAPVSPRLDVHVEAAAGDEMEAIAATVAFLHEHTTVGEGLWSFPATSGLLFAAGNTNVAPHDYWYPGRPDREGEERVVDLLRDKRPRFIVTLGKGWNFFDGAPVYFENLRGFVAGEYRLAARFGRYDVLGLRDASPDAPVPEWSAPLEAGVEDERALEASGARDEVLQPNLERRRQAAWRWMDAMTPEEAATATLPANRRDTILLLRALRDGGDMRGTGWALLGFESRDPRIRREAVEAMLAMAKTLASAEARFAHDFDATDYRAFVAPWIGRVQSLRAVRGPESFVQAAEKITGAEARVYAAVSTTAAPTAAPWP